MQKLSGVERGDEREIVQQIMERLVQAGQRLHLSETSEEPLLRWEGWREVVLEDFALRKGAPAKLAMGLT